MHNMSMTAVGVIPARYNSSRFPGKPLVSILGKSLLQRSYEQAQKVTLLDKLVIATDDARIYEHAKAFGADVVMTSSTCQNGTERMHEALSMSDELSQYDICVNIQGDEPCVNPESINTLIALLRSNPQDNMATLVTQIHDAEKINSPAICKCVFDQNGYALYFSRSPIPYCHIHTRANFPKDVKIYKHIGVYAFRTVFLKKYIQLPTTPLHMVEDLEMLKVLEHGYRIRVAEVHSDDAPDVNYPEDISKVEKFLCMSQKK